MSWESPDPSLTWRLKVWLRRVLKAGLFLAIVGLMGVGWYFYLASKYDLSEVAEMPARTVLLDRRGEELGALHGESRRLLLREEIPEFLVEALYAREDARFPSHCGVDFRGLARATARNLGDGDFTQGASTLTMQLARNTFSFHEDSLHRKLLEIAVSLRVEARYEKDEILTHYLNRIYFGSGANGLDQAARTYFAKPAQSLNRHQSALLVGIIRAPHAFSPFRDLEAAETQARQVLDRLVAVEAIPPPAKEEIMREPLGLVGEAERLRGSAHATRAVDRHLQVLLDRARIPDGGLTVTTGLDRRLQEEMEALSDSLPLPPGCEMGGISVAPSSGDILAILGTRETRPSSFNRALSARRGLGPVFTPFMECAAREAGVSPVPGEPLATGRQVGEKQLVELLTRLGFDGPFGKGDDLYRGSVAATPLEVATAGAALMNAGNRPHTSFIRRIQGPDGKVLFTGVQKAYPAFRRDSITPGTSGIFQGYSPPRTDYWHLTLLPDRVTVFWFGFDNPTPFQLTPDATRMLDEFSRN